MDLQTRILTAGIKNCLFLVPMKPLRIMFGTTFTSSSDEDVIVPCRISEERYRVAEGYKITLQSIYSLSASEHYYLSDLNKLIESNIIEMFVKPL